MSIKSAPESPTKKIMNDDILNSNPGEILPNNDVNDDLNECKCSESEVMCDNSDDWLDWL